MSANRPPPLPDEESLTPDEENDILARASEVEQTLLQGKSLPWDALFPPAPVVLDEDEEAEMARRIDEIPELDRRGLLTPVGDFLADMRKEIRQRRAG